MYGFRTSSKISGEGGSVSGGSSGSNIRLLIVEEAGIYDIEDGEARISLGSSAFSLRPGERIALPLGLPPFPLYTARDCANGKAYSLTYSDAYLSSECFSQEQSYAPILLASCPGRSIQSELLASSKLRDQECPVPLHFSTPDIYSGHHLQQVTTQQFLQARYENYLFE